MPQNDWAGVAHRHALATPFALAGASSAALRQQPLDRILEDEAAQGLRVGAALHGEGVAVVVEAEEELGLLLARSPDGDGVRVGIDCDQLAQVDLKGVQPAGKAEALRGEHERARIDLLELPVTLRLKAADAQGEALGDVDRAVPER